MDEVCYDEVRRSVKKIKKKIFHYRVKDSQNKLINGRAYGPDIASVRKLLEGKNYQILYLEERRSFLGRAFLGRVKAKDRSILYRELSTMLKAGVGISQAVEITQDSPNKSLRQIMREISSSLENGFPLSAAMATHSRVFPSVEVGVVKAGEATGNLANVLLELANTTAASAEFVGRIRSAMIYPAFILVVLTIVGAIIITRVIPPIKQIFIDTGQELPGSTKFLLGFTDLLINYWPWFVVGLVLAFLALQGFLKLKVGRRLSSLLSLRLPVFSELIKQYHLARFNRTMSLLLDAGVPIIEAVEIVSSSTKNVIINESYMGLSHGLEQGSSIASALKNNRYFPKMMVQLLRVGQQSGDLGGVMKTLADYYEAEVSAKLKTFSTLIEPFIIVIMGVMAGFVIISVLQPIYNLTGAF